MKSLFERNPFSDCLVWLNLDEFFCVYGGRFVRDACSIPRNHFCVLALCFSFHDLTCHIPSFAKALIEIIKFPCSPQVWPISNKASGIRAITS